MVTIFIAKLILSTNYYNNPLHICVLILNAAFHLATYLDPPAAVTVVVLLSSSQGKARVPS